jgi:hypothetical protein
MSQELESLRAEVAALRAEVAEKQDRSVTRRRLLTGLAGIGAAGAAGLAAAEPAAAADDDPVTLGARNTGDSTTVIEGSSGSVVPLLFLTGYPGQDPDDPPGPAGLLKISSPGFGIAVVAPGGTGVAAIAGGTAALDGLATDDAAGLRALASHGIGVDTGSIDGVPLRLRPGSGAPPTAALVAQPGSIYLDANCNVWLCTAAGDSPTWTRLLREDTATGRVVPIDPLRALDTRATGGRPAGSPAVPGQKQGPLHGQEALTLDLAGAGPIPTTAAGVVGNLTVINPDYSGYLVATPSGIPSSTSALNFVAGELVANAFTSRLGSDGLTLRANGSSGRIYHLVVDITAYIT